MSGLLGDQSVLTKPNEWVYKANFIVNISYEWVFHFVDKYMIFQKSVSFHIFTTILKTPKEIGTEVTCSG